MTAPVSYSFRADAVYPGGIVYFWFPEIQGDGITEEPAVPSGWGFENPSKYTSDYYRQWAWGIRVPVGAAPGDYTVTGHATDYTVTVVAEPVRTWKRVGDNVRLWQKLLFAGYSLEVEPGVYDVGNLLYMPDGTGVRARAPGTVTLRATGNLSGHNEIFHAGGTCILDGLTFDAADGLFPVYFFDTEEEPDAGQRTIRRCTVLKGYLQQLTSRGLLVDDCRFIRGSGGLGAPQGVWRNNLFWGHGDDHLFRQDRDESLLLSNTWEQTSRGIVIQGNNTTGVMAMDSTFIGVEGGEFNAGELILLEAAVPPNGPITPGSTTGIRGNAFIASFARNCTGGGIVIYGSGMHSNLFWDSKLHTDAFGIVVAALGGGTIGTNKFVNTELISRLELVGNCPGQTFVNIAWKDGPQLSGSAGMFPATYVDKNDPYPIYADAAAISAGSHSITNGRFIKYDRSIQSVPDISFTPS